MCVYLKLTCNACIHHTKCRDISTRVMHGIQQKMKEHISQSSKYEIVITTLKVLQYWLSSSLVVQAIQHIAYAGHTDTQDNYSNPRACVPRVKYYLCIQMWMEFITACSASMLIIYTQQHYVRTVVQVLCNTCIMLVQVYNCK